MLARLSLRLRIFLFFCLLALGGAALAGGAMYFGWMRSAGAAPAQPLITAFVLFAFLNTGLALGVWLLFDENVAKPIQGLAADMRLRAHSDVGGALDADGAKYLGDLASAAQAVTATLTETAEHTARAVEEETDQLSADLSMMSEVLSAIPVAVMILSEDRRIVLYDAQAAAILSGIAPPRLKAPLSDYFEDAELTAVWDDLPERGEDLAVTLSAITDGQRFQAKAKPLSSGGVILTLEAATVTLSPEDARPLTFDFDLLNAEEATSLGEAKLADLCFVAFDTETTGLEPAKDAVIQIGGVRILNGRMIEGEVFDSYVDPGRPIPPASTHIHGISDADVAGAPDFVEAGREFHSFAQDAVLVAHNAPFDLAFLRGGAAAMGVAWDHPVLDTVLLSACVFGVTEQHSLDALCERLEIELPDHLRHTALGDAKATGEALVKLIPLLEAKGLVTLNQVIAEVQTYGRLLEDMNAKP